MAIKGARADHGDDGATLDVIVSESGIGHPTDARHSTSRAWRYFRLRSWPWTLTTSSPGSPTTWPPSRPPLLRFIAAALKTPSRSPTPNFRALPRCAWSTSRAWR
ncbi:hypothetical protein [Micromonospora sp. CB01531]|uniref:hypothetical protein n=1 Tax=Micromonospora sp. CB01531 TaxID=1718947 RepID=UPI0018E9163B|nr:hypothetical protein [Micromonospora sp. CB01531]